MFSAKYPVGFCFPNHDAEGAYDRIDRSYNRTNWQEVIWMLFRSGQVRSGDPLHNQSAVEAFTCYTPLWFSHLSHRCTYNTVAIGGYYNRCTYNTVEIGGHYNQCIYNTVAIGALLQAIASNVGALSAQLYCELSVLQQGGKQCESESIIMKNIL